MSTVLPPTHEVVTVPEVMHALRLSRSKVYDLIRSGALPSYTEGRARRVPLESLHTYLRNKLEEAA
ncbi:helix-turn-helix domain-containing protein [Streptomyces sp. NPDC048270]|uniref:helix-turn-helix domain-containing protein n=1 Tax=Streptomyces sp. NPDC048270 TaxID=3154615 RepID=UPI0033C8E5DC